ncbi:LTA synthase family protein [Clostridium felsineum]|uniref:LTA synthase family protein n=1 Tax=Clostridium felsineum TaxID=36839 RepID=UPI00098CDF6B|nr:LTA synthase family protein [Clostridium felsineum]URZ16977.1 Lipoteichoic acid synthase 2 [Clostridium felsineum DSM 794]
MNNKLVNLKNNIKEFLLRHLYILYTIIAVTIKTINYEKLISPTFFSIKFILPPVLSSIIVICSISLLFKNKGRTRFLYFFNLIISILLIADSAYYRYFKDCISLSVIRNGILLSGVSSSLRDLLYPSDFIYLIDCIILIPLIRIFKGYFNKTAIFKIRFAEFLILLCIALPINILKIYSLTIEQPTLISTMVNKMYIAKVIGIVNFQVIDAYNVISTKVKDLKTLPPARQKEIKNYLKKKDSYTTSNFTGAAKGKNLIMIQVEALQQFVIGAKMNGQEITPNLNRWMGKSLYFNNYFYQVASGVTSDAEFLSNNSLYPADSGAAYYMYCNDTYDSLARQMNNNGYYTTAINGYKEGFWNRNVMYKAEDFHDYFAERNYNINETVGLGLSDKSWLNQTLPMMKNFKQPYFSFLITLSSHYPYDDQKGYGNFDVGKYKGTLLGNYLNGIHYTDAQLGMFLDNLEKQGMLDNSIVVLYGDHFAIPKNSIEDLYNFENIKNPTNLDWYELQKVPMFIHFPHDENKGVNSMYSSQIDLYPTIANLFGLDKKYMFGSDLLNTQNNVVTFRNGSFTDGKYFYVSFEDSYYDIDDKKTIKPTSKLKAMKEDSLTQLQYSDDILNHNLMKTFLKDDSKDKKR